MYTYKYANIYVQFIYIYMYIYIYIWRIIRVLVRVHFLGWLSLRAEIQLASPPSTGLPECHRISASGLLQTRFDFSD